MGELFNSKSNLDILSFIDRYPSESDAEKLILFLYIIKHLKGIYKQNLLDTLLNLNALFISVSDQEITVEASHVQCPEYPSIPPEAEDYLDWPIELRSNLYVLGIIGYFIFNQRLPSFSEDGALCLDMSLDVPPMIRLMLEKLLSWYPDDRYQTIDGLIHDLEICRSALDNSQDINPFILGKKDLSNSIDFGHYLFGRGPEFDLLNNLLEKSFYSTQILFLGGYSGVGKTSLIRSFLRGIDSDLSVVLVGKCDQYSNESYLALSGILKDLLDVIEEDKAIDWKGDILKALGANARVLIDLLPEFRSLLGELSSLPELPVDNISFRIQYVLVALFQCIADRIGRLVLFIDDMQWGDTLTMKIVHELLKRNLPVLIICAYRDNECLTPHIVKEYRKIFLLYQSHFTDHHLSSLSKEATEEMLNSAIDECQSQDELLHVLYQKTKGNPFFMKEMIHGWVRDDVLSRDVGNACWNVREESLLDTKTSVNVAGLVRSRIGFLPEELRSLLSIASFLGNQFSKDMLLCASDLSLSLVERYLHAACVKEFIFEIDEEQFSFAHDVIQQEFYALVPESDRGYTYLVIARRLLRNLSDWDSTACFKESIVTFFNKGSVAIQDHEEFSSLISMNYDYIKQLINVAAFEDAHSILQSTNDLLRHAPDCIDLEKVNDMKKMLVEMKYALGHFEEADTLVDDLIDSASSPFFSVELLDKKAKAYQGLNSFDRVLTISKRALGLLGINLPDVLSRRELLMVKLQAYWNLIKSKCSLSHLEETHDPRASWILTFVIHSGVASWFSGRSDWVTYFILFGLNKMYKEGITDESSFIASTLSMHCSNTRVRAANHFANEALKIAQKCNSEFYIRRARYGYAGSIAYWEHSYSYCCNLLENVIQECCDSGNEVTRMYASISLLDMYFESGVTMQTMRDCMDRSLWFVDLQRRGSIGNYYSFGLYQNFILFGDFIDAMEGANTILYSRELSHSSFGYYISGVLQATHSYVMQSYDDGIQILNGMARYESDFKIGNLFAYFKFLKGIYAVKNHSLTIHQKERILKDAIRYFKSKLKGNESNFKSRYRLLQGEYFSILNKLDKSLEAYNSAIVFAQQEKHYNFAAIASERAYEVSCQLNDMMKANYYLNQAIQSYSEWGAVAKVNALESQRVVLTA